MLSRYTCLYSSSSALQYIIHTIFLCMKKKILAINIFISLTYVKYINMNIYYNPQISFIDLNTKFLS